MSCRPYLTNGVSTVPTGGAIVPDVMAKGTALLRTPRSRVRREPRPRTLLLPHNSILVLPCALELPLRFPVVLGKLPDFLA